MGKFSNKFYDIVTGVVLSRHINKKQLKLSVISLILALLVLVSSTYCWFSVMKSQGTADNVVLDVGNGLRVNDLGDTSKKFKDDSLLLPASSCDGRNIFFPADGTDFSKETSLMTFRSANAGDRNYDYVQLDFNLTAEANYTEIYLDKGASLKIDVPDDATTEYRNAAAQAQRALRLAIYYDGMEKPALFTSMNNPTSVEAVKEVDRTTGRFLKSDTQVAVPFRDYTYGKRQLAMLNQGETRPFSIIIWLEGSDMTNCISDYVMLKQLKMNLKFTTCWDNTTTITFDTGTATYGTDTLAKILQDNPAYSLVLNYNNDSRLIKNLRFTMKKKDANDYSKWTCNIPDNAYSDLVFMILDGADNNNVVYQWEKTTGSPGTSTKNRGTASLYTVDTISGLDSRGHWHDGPIEDQGEGKDIGDILDDDDW